MLPKGSNMSLACAKDINADLRMGWRYPQCFQSVYCLGRLRQRKNYAHFALHSHIDAPVLYTTLIELAFRFHARTPSLCIVPSLDKFSQPDR